MGISTFTHCDSSEENLTLHDCVAERATLHHGILTFDFKDGFWIGPHHPENALFETARTDFSRVEYILDKDYSQDVIVFVFKRTIFKQIIRTEWTIQQLIDHINSGICTFEFLYQYTDAHSRIIEGALRFDKKPYDRECMIKVFAPKVNYYWNNLCEDWPW